MDRGGASQPVPGSVGVLCPPQCRARRFAKRPVQQGRHSCCTFVLGCCTLASGRLSRLRRTCTTVPHASDSDTVWMLGSAAAKQGTYQQCARAETVSSQPGAPLLQSTLSPVALQVPVSQSAQQLQAVAQQPVTVRQAPATGTQAVLLVHRVTLRACDGLATPFCKGLICLRVCCSHTSRRCPRCSSRRRRSRRPRRPRRPRRRGRQ